MNNYELTRRYWDWAKENPELTKPTHAALFFYIIEKCVRMGWQEKFSLPTDLAKDAIGVRNYKTYIESLYFLEENGFIKMIQRSKNQHTANIIALVNFTKAHTKAHTKADGKADGKASPKQVQSIASIINDYNYTNELNDSLEEVHPATDFTEEANTASVQLFDSFFGSYIQESKHTDANGVLRNSALTVWDSLTDEEKIKAVSVGTMYAKIAMQKSKDKDPKYIKRPHTFLSEKIFLSFDLPKPLEWIQNPNGTYTFVDTDDRTKRYSEDRCFRVGSGKDIKWYLKE